MPSQWTRTDLLIKWFELSVEERDDLLESITGKSLTVEDIMMHDVEDLWNQILEAKGNVWDLLGIDCSNCDQNPKFACGTDCNGFYGCYQGCKEEHIVCDYFGHSQSLCGCSDKKISDLIICFICGGWKAVLDYYIEDGAKINLKAMQKIKHFLEESYDCYDDGTKIFEIETIDKNVEKLVSNIIESLETFSEKTTRRYYIDYDNDKIIINLF